jgi:predicted ribosomally synthesized peptide with SipW-like signal peptide
VVGLAKSEISTGQEKLWEENMKKYVILAVVVVTALALAGVGGVFATWSDSETSFGNTISTGSVDLKVNGADDKPWGTGVPAKFNIDCMIPCKFYGPYEVELWNAGQCTFPSHAYLEVKNVTCSNILPKVNPYDPRDPESGGSAWWYAIYGPGATTGYLAPDGSGLKPEPELVAEYGGKVDCFTVPGIGPEGDECSMGTHTEMIVTATPLAPNDPKAEVIGRDKLVKWLNKEVPLFDLMPCVPRTIYLWFHLQQDSEEMYGFDFVPDPGDPGFDLLYWKKFNDWPSWAMMKDKATIAIEFDLWLEDTPGAVVYPEGYVA